MIVATVFDHTPQMDALAWGNDVIDTTPGNYSGWHLQAGAWTCPFLVPDLAIECVIDSPFDTDGSEGWMGPTSTCRKASIHLGPKNMAIDPEGTTVLTIRQLKHSHESLLGSGVRQRDLTPHLHPSLHEGPAPVPPGFRVWFSVWRWRKVGSGSSVVLAGSL